MKRFVCILLVLSAALVLSSCGVFELLLGNYMVEEPNERVSTLEVISEDESSEASISEEPEDGDYYLQYKGQWLMNDEGNYSILYFDEEIYICTYVSPYGEAFIYGVEAYSDKVVIYNEEYSEELSFEDGDLADMSGHKYVKDDILEVINQSFVGLWGFESEIGYNALRIYPNGTYNMEAADGTVDIGKYTVSDTEIILDGGSVFIYTESGNLEDMAGFNWEKDSDLPY